MGRRLGLEDEFVLVGFHAAKESCAEANAQVVVTQQADLSPQRSMVHCCFGMRQTQTVKDHCNALVCTRVTAFKIIAQLRDA